MKPMLNKYFSHFANSSGVEALISAAHGARAIMALTEMDLTKVQQEASASFWDFSPNSFLAMLRPYEVTNGILTIPVKGVLLHDFSFSFFGMATGYEYIQQATARGLEDDEVKGIAYIYNSPGGVCTSCFDLSDYLYSVRDVKPSVAIVDATCCSAAYALASAQSKIIAPRTSDIGSIGVVSTHYDESKALEMMGIKVTQIYEGHHKVDGASNLVLSTEVKERMQFRVSETYTIFVETVARNRGMTVEAVKATEAQYYDAKEALSLGLIDSIRPVSAKVMIARETFEIVSNNMQEQTEMTTPVAVTTATTEVVSTPVDATAALSAARTEGATSERARISAILALPEAEGRGDSAMAVATTTDMSVEAAGPFLAKLPKLAAVAPAGTSFADAMAKSGNPDIAPGNEEKPETNGLLASLARRAVK
jgi:capsid assembly protease